jgi:hypothetical protein
VNTRHLSSLRLLVATAIAVSAVSAFTVTASAGPRSKADAVSQTVNWTLRTPAPFAGTRFDGEYVSSLRRVYFLGFRTLGDVTDGSVWYYDVAANTYVDTGVDMRVPVSNYQISMLQDSRGLGLYIFGGRDATPTAIDTVQVYYPAGNTARTVPSDPYPGQTPSGCTTLPANGVATLQNKAYVIGGLGFSSLGCVDENSAETWVFDPMAAPGTRWTQGPNLNVARGYITPTVLGRRIYAIGGDTNSAGTLFATSTVEAWAPPAGGWDDAGIADLPTICDEAQAYGFRTGPLAGGVVLAGCGQWPNAIPDTHFYDQATNTWSVVGAFNENRRNHAGALIPRGGGRSIMYILGGYGEASGFIDPIFSQENGEGAPAGGPVRTGSSSGASGGGVPTS